MASTIGEAVIRLSFDGSSIKASLEDVSSQVKKNGTESGKSWGEAWSVAAGNLVASGIKKIANVITNNLGKAINRVDTINNFPRVMTALGYSSESASGSIDTLSERLLGLPTSLQDGVTYVQKLAATMGNLNEGTVNATSLGLALNDMFLAGGKGAEGASRALEQYNQMLANGKVDMMSWRSVNEVASGQLKQLAQTFLGAEANAMDLYKALQDGVITFDQMNEAIVRLDQEGGQGFESFEKQARAATGGIGTALENVQNRIAQAIGKVIQRLDAEKIASIINDISSHFGDLANVVIGLIDFIEANWGVIAPILGVLTGIASAVVAINVAMKAYQKIQKAVNIVTTAFSKILGGVSGGISKVTTVFSKSPIGGMASKVGDTLKKLGDIIKNALKSIGEAIAGFFKAFADPAILLGAAMFATAAASIAAAIFLIGTAVGAIMPVLKDLFNNIIMPIAQFIVNTVLQLIEALTNAIIELTQNAIIPLGEFLVGSFVTILETVSNVMINLTQGAVIPLIEILSGAFTSVINAIGNLLTNVIRAALEGVAEVTRAVGEGFEHMGNAIKTALEGVRGVLQVFADLISSISEAAVAIVALATGHSINYGGGYAHLFSEGGRVVGEGTSTSDSIPAMLSNGEYVINAVSAKAIGYNNLDKLNNTTTDWSNSILSDVSSSFGERNIGGGTINVYMTNDIDNRLDAEEIGRTMIQSIRRYA